MISEYLFDGKRYSKVTNAYEDNRWVTLHLLYDGKLSIKKKQESGQMFYRDTLSGDLIFQRAAYEWIMNSDDYATLPMWTRFDIRLKKVDGTVVENLSFTLTDCKIDVDNKTITVTPTISDDYQTILDGMSEEFNLTEIGAEMQPMTYKKRPIVEVFATGGYTQGIGYQRGQSFISDIDTSLFTCDYDGYNLLNTDYYFYHILGYKILDVTCSNSDIAGRYIGRADSMYSYTYTFYRVGGGDYRIVLGYNVVALPSFSGFEKSLKIKDSDNNEVNSYTDVETTSVLQWEFMTNQTIEGVDENPDAVVSMTTIRFFARLLCDVNSIDGVATYDKPSDDVSNNSGNYTKVLPLNMGVMAQISGVVNTTVNNYWYGDGKYYQPPTTDKGRWQPIAQSEWGEYSLWLDRRKCDYSNVSAESEVTIKDCYKVSSVIQQLLTKIGSSVTHLPNVNYSQFLYGLNQISSDDFRLLMTQKTNIKVSNYDNAAKKAPITLEEIFTMLKNVFNCYWFIDSSSRLRIEHISYFLNGKSYAGSVQTIYKDLTTLYNPTTDKTWAWKTNNYQFEKSEMSEIIEFEWQDDTSDVFDGAKMQIQAPFVQIGKSETRSAGNFTSNIDYVLQRPDDIADDGFMLFAAQLQGLGADYLPYILPCASVGDVFGANTYVQNYMLAYPRLERNYFRYDIAGYKVKIGENEYQVIMSDRKKTNEVIVPDCDIDLSPYNFIKTLVGNGLITEITINLHSKIGKVKLNYATE